MAGMARKQREKQAKRRAKKARREANQLHYQQLRDQGKNEKSKRYVLNARNAASHGKHKHEISNCGNHGCKKCTPREDKPHTIILKEKLRLGLTHKTKLSANKLFSLGFLSPYVSRGLVEAR